MAETEAFELERIQRNPWVMALASVPLAFIPLLWTVALATGQPGFLLPTLHFGVAGAFAATWAWRRNPWRRRKKVRVEVEEDAVVVGGERIPRSTLTRGVVVPRGAELEVHLARRGPDVELAVKDVEEAHRLLEKLGFDAHQTVAAFRAKPAIFRSVVATIGAALGTFAATGLITALVAQIAPAAAPAPFLLGIAAFLTLMLTPSRIEVGADGILIRWLGTQRFVSHGEIATTDTSVRGLGRNKMLHVVLTLTTGQELTIPMTHPRWDDGRAAALVTRIREAGAVFRSGSAEEAALLERGDRPHLTWVSLLRAGGVASLRTAALSKDRLWRLIEDASADALERAAAAIALGKDLPREERTRLDRAARATAAPKLRVVLETATEAPEAELAEHLADLEEPKQKKRAR